MGFRSAIWVLLLVVFAGAVRALPTKVEQSLVRPEPAPSCELCEGLVTSFSKFLADPKNEELARQILHSTICDTMPDAMHDICVAEVDVLYTQVVASMISALDPSDVCQLAGMCPPTGALVDITQGPLDCPMCRILAATLLQRFKDPKVRDSMRKGLLEACEELPLLKQLKCKADVEALFLSIESIMDDLDPDMACEVAQFCPKPDADLLARRRPGVDVMGAGAAMFHELVELKRVMPGGVASDEGCQNCKVIVLQAVAVLQNPKTQEEMIEYAKSLCDSFATDWSDTCKSYVTLYGPLLMNMLVTYLQPELICEELGYCKPPALF